MVKGVNKQIIEINGDENDYFDKAILFVKPERRFISQNSLQKEAKTYIQNLEEKPQQHKLSFSKAYFKYTLAALGGGVITSIFMIGLL